MGFGMMLVQNADAMSRFASMSAGQQQQVLDGVKGIKSRQAMRSYVSSLSEMN